MTKRNLIITVGALLGMLCIATVSNAATTWYISPNGSNTNGNGSSANPWATLSYACSRVTTAGDTIYLNAGTYNDSVQCRLAVGVNIQGAGKTGTKIISNLNDFYLVANNNPVVDGNQTISGFTLDGNNKTLAHGFQIIGRNNVTVDNVDFNRIKDGAIKLEGTDWWTGADQEFPPVPPPAYAKGCVLKNITVTGCSPAVPYSAVWIQSVEDLLIDNMTIDESAGTGGLGNALKSYPGWVKHSVIRNSTFIVNPNTGMDAIPMEIWTWETDCDVYNNTFKEGYLSLVSGRKNGGTWALKFHDNMVINTKPLGTAHELSLDDLDFYNNYVEGESLGIWAATHQYNMDGVSNVRIRNNVVYNANGQGITVQNGPGAVTMDSIQIYNNVIDTTNRSWPDAGIWVSSNLRTNFTNLQIKNNIFNNLTYGVTFNGNPSYIQSPQVSYNDFFNVTTQIDNGGVTAPAFSNNFALDPQFVKTGSKPQYYKLMATSPLINKGTNVGLPFTGTAPDMGAFEFTTIAAPTNLRVVQ